MSKSNLLTLRKIPFDLAACLKGFTLKTLIDNLAGNMPGGEPWVIGSLAGSLWIEFAEREIMYLHKVAPATNGEHVDMFIKQEAAHAGYHHILNKVIEPRYRDLKVGPKQINFMVYPQLGPGEETYLAIESQDPVIKAAAIKRLWLKIAAFEFSVGVFWSIAHFQTWEPIFNELLEANPFFVYLWMYHYAEEMEHAHVPVQQFESY
jgi:predicted metal-dependent hydrolase